MSAVPAARPSPAWRGDWRPHALLGLGLGLALMLLAAVSIWQERVRQHERAVASTQNLARLLEAHVADVVTKCDVLLQAGALQWRELSPRDGPAAAAGVLRNLAATVPRLQNLQVAGADGHWQLRVDAGADALAPGPVDAGTQGALQQWQARGTSAGPLTVQGPLRRAADKPWVLVLGRPIPGPDGRPAGLITADLPVTTFDTLFSTIDLGEHGAATIRTTELALVFRRPWPREGMGAAVGTSTVSPELRQALADNPLAGEYLAPTALDGIARINAYRKVGDHPLLLLVGLPESEFPRGWNDVDAAIVTLAAVTLGLAALALGALLRLQRRAVDAAQRRLAAIVESSQDAIVGESTDGLVTSWNRGAEQMFGYTAAEMIGQPLHRLWPPERQDETAELLARVHRGEPVAHFETERLCRDGRRLAVSMSVSPVYDERGQRVGTSRIARDISAQKALADEVRQLAFMDPLTRLPNRRLLMDRLRHAQQVSRRLGTHGAVLFLDLDGFKQLNDRLGHEAGDQRLVQVAQCLRESVRETDTVARLGGDEFVVVCENLSADPAQAEADLAGVVAKIGAQVARPLVLAGQPVQGGASIGQRLFIGADDAPEKLLAEADAAMYRHKLQRRQAAPAPAAPAPVTDEEDSEFGTL